MDIYWSVALLYLELVTLLGNTFLNIYASTLYIIIPVVAFVAAGWWMQRVYMKAQREFYRLEGVTKSPILSYFTETVNGMPTVRAYHRTEDFMMVHAQHINVNRKIQLQQLYTNAWF
jgi:ABC-type bacteriocin/lantibiotic exporter with double-glycine peptidase domain